MTRSAKAYRLVPAEIPSQAGRGGHSLYRDIVTDFVASDLETALVEVPGRKPNSINVGLRKAVSVSGATVKVRMRGGQLYLQKA